MEQLKTIEDGSLEGAIEALLLVACDPVPATELAHVLGVTPGEASEALANLSAEYSDANRGFQLREVAGGWRLYTHPAYHEQVESFVASWDTRRLSQAALETIAVIAYQQPITREGVRAIRGVNSEGVISTLVDKGLVREVGRESGRSQAILYGTTQTFLEHFGLKSLKDLPDLEQFAPDEKAKEFIRERLAGRQAPGTLDEEDPELEDDLTAEDELEIAVADDVETGFDEGTDDPGDGDGGRG